MISIEFKRLVDFNKTINTNYNVGIYKPLTILSFNHLKEEALSPVLICDDANRAAFNYVKSSGSVTLPTIHEP